ncbi:unnamed protein product [marine sediment metagenome]|uniref:Uncharacterized protein n=1 Tax=marine sediment metagenome TaxID=412755 RepID=X0XUF1_9ZZZZ
MSKERIPEYLRRLNLAVTNGIVPAVSVNIAAVFHDDWCVSYQGGACNCDPEIIVTHEGHQFHIDKNGEKQKEN